MKNIPKEKICTNCFKLLPIDSFKQYANSINKKCIDCMAKNGTTPAAVPAIPLELPLDNRQRISTLGTLAKLGFSANAAAKNTPDGLVSLYLPQGWRQLKNAFNSYIFLIDSKSRKRIKYTTLAELNIEFLPAVTTEVCIAAHVKDLSSRCVDLIAIVRLCGSIVFTQPTAKEIAAAVFTTLSMQQLKQAAEAYAESEYPDYKNPLAYWD